MVIKKVFLINWWSPFVNFKVRCSKGAYICSLISDIGEKLGVYVHVVKLVRIKTGKFSLKKVYDFNSLSSIKIKHN